MIYFNIYKAPTVQENLKIKTLAIKRKSKKVWMISKMKNNSTIVEDSSDLAANEIVGDIENLLELANKH